MVGTEPAPTPPVSTGIRSSGMIAPHSSPRLSLPPLPSSADRRLSLAANAQVGTGQRSHRLGGR